MKKTTKEPEGERPVAKQNILEPKDVLEKLMERANAELDKEDLKMSVADLIRLLQWRKEVTQEEDGPREIEVRWVDELVVEEKDS